MRKTFFLVACLFLFSLLLIMLLQPRLCHMWKGNFRQYLGLILWTTSNVLCEATENRTAGLWMSEKRRMQLPGSRPGKLYSINTIKFPFLIQIKTRKFKMRWKPEGVSDGKKEWEMIRERERGIREKEGEEEGLVKEDEGVQFHSSRCQLWIFNVRLLSCFCSR